MRRVKKRVVRNRKYIRDQIIRNGHLVDQKGQISVISYASTLLLAWAFPAPVISTLFNRNTVQVPRARNSHFFHWCKNKIYSHFLDMSVVTINDLKQPTHC